MKFLSGLWVAVLMLLPSVQTVNAQITPSAAVAWANSVYNDSVFFPSLSRVTASAMDAADNHYVAGVTIGSVRIGTQLFLAADTNRTTNLIKYAPNGNVEWVQRFGSNNYAFSNITDLKCTPTGEVLVTGSFEGSITISGTVISTPANQRDYYVMKWSSTGSLLWAATGGGNGIREPQAIALDNSGNIYLGGWFRMVSNFGNFVLTPGNPQNLIQGFLAKLSPNGTVLDAWAASSSTGASLVRSVGLDQAGNMYIDGYFSNTLSWGNVLLTEVPTAINSNFWFKLNAAGQPLEHKVTGGFNTYNQLRTMVVDAAGNSYRTNIFTGTINLGGVSFSTSNINNRDAYLAKYDPNGVLQWATHLTGMGVGSDVEGTVIVLDNQGTVYLGGYIRGDVVLDTIPLSGQYVHYAAAFDGFTGDILWARKATGAGNLVLEPSLAVSPNGQVGWAGDFINGPLVFDGGVVTGTQVNPNTISFFTARLLQNYNTITGSVFVDANANTLQDTGETGLPEGAMVQVIPGLHAYHSAAAGPYSAIAELGLHEVALTNPPIYYTVIPTGPASPNFTTYGNTSANHNFALQPIPNQQDLRVLVTPLLPARPGFPTAYRITYSNPGTVAMLGGTVTLSLDPQFTYLSSVPAGTMSANTITWTYANLLPGQTRNINVNLSLPTSAVVGNPVTVTASITPVADDLTPADNSETNTRPITASYDPNLIEVNHEELALQQVQTGQWLEYTIHFQNLGTDTAFTVMLRDSLPAGMLKIGTISLLAASHSCSWSVNSAGIMTVLFTNIKLPHQAANVLGSHGFIRFRIKPQNSLNVGAIIPNRAKIYFDYNPAITTNIAETEVVNQTAAQGLLPSDAWQLYPNPTSGTVTVTANLGRFERVNLRLLNALGQEMYSARIANAEEGLEQEINLRNLPSGVYSVQLQTEHGSVVKPLVKQ